MKDGFTKRSFTEKPGLLKVLGLMMMFLLSQVSFSQVATNSGSGLAATYPSLDAAITALNAATITSPVTIVLTGNETAPAGGYVITAQGTAGNTISISGSGSTITASAALTAGVLYDGIFKLVGADYVTIQNFTMVENGANTTTAAATNNMTEWGVALLYASATNGCQNVTIQNNIIDLNRTYQNTFAIYSNSTHTATAVSATASATGATGGNHGLKIFNNVISDVNIGIAVVGPTAAADYNDGLDIGALAAGNSITDFGTTSFTSSYANLSGTVNGILVRNTKNFNVAYNTITSSNGGVTTGTVRGIYIPAFSNSPIGTITNNINNNTLSIKSGVIAGAIISINCEATTTNATTTLNVNNNDFNASGHTVAGTAAITFILNAAVPLTTNINGNTFSNLSVNTTGNVVFISNSVTRPANAVCNINNNAIVGTFAKTGAGGTLTFYTSNSVSPSTATETNSGNNFSNITVTGGTTIAGWGSTDGSTSAPFGPSKTVSNNTFSNIAGGTNAITILNVGYSNSGATNTVANNTVTGITGAAGIIGISSANGSQNFSGNIINGLASTGAATVSAMSVSGGVAQNVYKNKIYNIEANNAAGVVNGILVSGATTVNVYNNIIGDLRTPLANATNPLIGINITGGTTVNAYYNTVMLNASSTGALFGSSAISASTTPTVTLRNNIFVNNSTVMGAGLAAAYRRSSTALGTYGAASNNNLFFGSRIFTDGTNTDATLGAYKTRVSPRDAASVSENPTFTSTVGANAQFLHINTTVPTLIESGGAPIGGFTDDFDGDLRNASTPDIGADEFAGTPIPVVVINSVSASPLGNLCTAASRTITANITAGGNDITSVTLNYSFNGVAQTPIAMTGGTLTTGTTSNFTATIPVAVPANASVTWSVTAVDPLVTKNTVGTAYQDAPLTGAVATAVASVPTLCNSGTSVLSANLTGNSTLNLGAGALVTANSGTSSSNYVSPFTHYFGGYKAQYILRASELTAAGFSAGSNLTSLAFDVTTAGTTYNGFTLSIGTTAATAMTTTFDVSPVTQVFTGNVNAGSVGLVTLPFGTGGGSAASYVWDGTSNILINLCWSNNNTGGTAAEVRYDTTSFVAMAYYRVDSATAATVCAVATATATTSNRPKMVFGGTNLPVTPSLISWSDGSTVVGTGNNLSVSPTATTTYTATLTYSGCTIDTNSTTVTFNSTATPTASATVQPTCTVPTGTIVVTAPLGATMEYSTDGATYQSSTTFSGLAPGSYNVTVRDTSTSCVSAATSVTINAIPAPPAAPTASVTMQPTCTVPTGTITITAPLGAGFEYSVDGATYQATATFSGLAPATYSVTVRDTATGCVSSATSVVVDPIPAAPAAPTASATVQPSCLVPTGTIDVTAPTGATLEYSITGITYQTSMTFAGLTPGSYSVTVRDTTTGCVSTATMVTINAVPAAPAAPTASVTSQPTCIVPSGTITITAPVGASFEYSVDGATYQASTTFAGLAPAVYSVTVRDTGTGCVSTGTSVTVNAVPAAPAAPTASATVQPTCSLPTGTITVSAPIGAGFDYSIDGVVYQASTTFSALAPATYNVTVRDTATGCVSSATSVTINAIPAAPAAPTSTVTQPTCAVSTGSIQVSAPLGATLEYSIDGSTYQSSTTFTGLSSATYSVTVRDTATGCVSSASSETINAAPTVPGAPTGSQTQVISVTVPTDATIEDIVVTGSNIIWYPTNADALAGTNALPAGTVLVSGSTYYATQTVGSCTSTSALDVTVTVTLGTNDVAMSGLKVYPNPTTGILTIENAQAISGVEIFNLTGQIVRVKTVNELATTIDMSGLASGTYLVRVTSDAATKTLKVIKN